VTAELKSIELFAHFSQIVTLVNRAQSCKQHGESIENQLQQLCNVDATSLVNAFDVAEFLHREIDQLLPKIPVQSADKSQHDGRGTNEQTLADHMNEWMGRQKGCGMRLELLYRASRDGFKVTDFHRLCEHKGATVTVIRSKEGYVFGGYVDQSWNCSKGWVASSSAFLFSLVRPSSSVAMKLPLNGRANEYAMRCNSLCGPTFGGGFDIVVWDSANNSDSRTNLGHSYTLPDGIKDGSTFFTGARYFQASEVEVYRVVG
jgi:hypothetical protein